MKITIVSIVLLSLLAGTHAQAQDAKSNQEKTYQAQGTSTTAKRPSGGSKDSTNINFEATLLEGKMKAPAGTFLQGRKIQDKTQMVNLRKHFRRELRRSRGGVSSQVN